MAVNVTFFNIVCTCLALVILVQGEMKRYSRDGDINIGGLFPLHFYDEANQQCGRLRELGALKKVEAMVYTIDRINLNDSLLSNITLGFDIYDSCSYDAMALQTSLQMVPLVKRSDSRLCDILDKDPVVGMVGAQRSSSSKQAALLLGHYQIPQVSFLSTSDELSNTDRYPYFLRTVAPDRFQVRVMIDLLRHFGWKYVSFLNSDDSFGKSAQREFRQQAGDLDICLGIVRTISLYADEVTYDEVINDLLYKQTSQTTVVLLFAQLETVYGILSAANRARAYRSFIWIGGDGWGNYNDLQGIREYMQATVGAFTVAPLSKTLPDYDKHFNTEVQHQQDNPWLQEFWQKYGNCSLTNTQNGDVKLGWCDPPTSSVHESLVMDSTLAFIYALHKMQLDKCHNSTVSKGICQDLRDALRTEEVLNYLLQTEFTSPANGQIKFTEAGDGGGKYAVFNLQEHEDDYAFVRVGTWDEGSSEYEALTLNMPIPWYLKDMRRFDPDTGYPKSICSEVCGPGEKTSFFPENPCCWTCTKCQAHEKLSMNSSVCISCIDVSRGTYAWPSDDFSECKMIKPVVNLKENAWAIVMILLSGLGVIFTLILIVFYVINKEKRLIKASSRELSCLIFVGIFLSYVTSMLYILPPHPVICGLLRLGPPVANSLVYVSVATKTIRLYRIFMAGKKSVKRPKFISPTFQVSMSLAICVIPISWVTIWLIVVPPEVVLDMPDIREPRVEHTCSQRMIERIGTMIWDIGLVLVCCIYAFRTRKLPNNYKESRFITFCVFSTLLVLLAFSPTIFTTREPFYRSVYSALGLIVIATVANLCLFVIKLYALYFVSEKDLVLSTVNERGSTIRKSAPEINANATQPKMTSDTAQPKMTYLTVKPEERTSPLRHRVDVASPPSPVDFHTPTSETTAPDSAELQRNQATATSGDINLGFQPDDEHQCNLENNSGGVYIGPRETAT